MRIILCIDYAPFTEKVLTALQNVIRSVKDCKITVVHIIDEALFTGGTGFEIQLNEDLKRDGQDLKNLAIHYLGQNISYIEEYGIPRQKLDEIRSNSQYDLLVIGNHSKSLLGTRRIGGVAEHLLLNTSKPVLVIP